MEKLKSNWKWMLIRATLEDVSLHLEEISEKGFYLKSVHILGDKILFLVGYPKKES